MSDLKERFQAKCLLKLKDLPKSWESGGQKLCYCPLAVIRLKAIKAAKNNSPLTESQEANLPGCPYSIKSQMSGYCFFIQEARRPDIPLLDIEIASLLDITIDQVKAAAESAILKIQADPMIMEIKQAVGSESVIEERLSVEDEYINFD